MANFPKLLVSTRKQIQKNGQRLDYEREDLSGYAPGSTSPILNNQSKLWSAYTLVLPFNKRVRNDFDEGILEGTTRLKARLLLIAPDEADGSERPQAGDLITYETETWRIRGAVILSFQGTDILYKAVIVRL